MRPPGLKVAVAGTLAAASLLAGCGGSTSGPAGAATSASPTGPSPSPSASSSPTTSPAPTEVGRAPLTGLPVADAARLARSTVAVVVGLIPGHAVTGVRSADLVYAEFDRPGHTRLLALYQSTDAYVGPVAATAPVDERLLTLFGSPAYGFADGPTGFVAQAKAPTVTARDLVTYRSLYRASGGSFFASTTALRASAPAVTAPLAGALTFASTSAPAPSSSRALRRIVVSVPGQAAMTWIWNGQQWAGPAGSLITNLVVQYVKYKTLTPHKSPVVGSAQVIGSGVAAVYAGRHGLSVAWLRLFPGLVTVYKRGIQPVGLVPGRTWVLLVPAGTKVTTS